MYTNGSMELYTIEDGASEDVKEKLRSFVESIPDHTRHDWVFLPSASNFLNCHVEYKNTRELNSVVDELLFLDSSFGFRREVTTSGKKDIRRFSFQDEESDDIPLLVLCCHATTTITLVYKDVCMVTQYQQWMSFDKLQNFEPDSLIHFTAAPVNFVPSGTFSREMEVIVPDSQVLDSQDDNMEEEESSPITGSTNLGTTIVYTLGNTACDEIIDKLREYLSTEAGATLDWVFVPSPAIFMDCLDYECEPHVLDSRPNVKMFLNNNNAFRIQRKRTDGKAVNSSLKLKSTEMNVPVFISCSSKISQIRVHYEDITYVTKFDDWVSFNMTQLFDPAKLYLKTTKGDKFVTREIENLLPIGTLEARETEDVVEKNTNEAEICDGPTAPKRHRPSTGSDNEEEHGANGNTMSDGRYSPTTTSFDLTRIQPPPVKKQKSDETKKSKECTKTDGKRVVEAAVQDCRRKIQQVFENNTQTEIVTVNTSNCQVSNFIGKVDHNYVNTWKCKLQSPTFDMSSMIFCGVKATNRKYRIVDGQELFTAIQELSTQSDPPSERFQQVRVRVPKDISISASSINGFVLSTLNPQTFVRPLCSVEKMKVGELLVNTLGLDEKEVDKMTTAQIEGIFKGISIPNEITLWWNIRLAVMSESTKIVIRNVMTRLTEKSTSKTSRKETPEYSHVYVNFVRAYKKDKEKAICLCNEFLRTHAQKGSVLTFTKSLKSVQATPHELLVQTYKFTEQEAQEVLSVLEPSGAHQYINKVVRNSNVRVKKYCANVEKFASEHRVKPFSIKEQCPETEIYSLVACEKGSQSINSFLGSTSDGIALLLEPNSETTSTLRALGCFTLKFYVKREKTLKTTRDELGSTIYEALLILKLNGQWQNERAMLKYLAVCEEDIMDVVSSKTIATVFAHYSDSTVLAASSSYEDVLAVMASYIRHITVDCSASEALLPRLHDHFDHLH